MSHELRELRFVAREMLLLASEARKNPRAIPFEEALDDPSDPSLEKAFLRLEERARRVFEVS